MFMVTKCIMHNDRKEENETNAKLQCQQKSESRKMRHDKTVTGLTKNQKVTMTVNDPSMTAKAASTHSVTQQGHQIWDCSHRKSPLSLRLRACDRVTVRVAEIYALP